MAGHNHSDQKTRQTRQGAIKPTKLFQEYAIFFAQFLSTSMRIKIRILTMSNQTIEANSTLTLSRAF